MEVFIANITTFPTVFFSVLLVASIGFWLLNLIGLFNFDAFDLDVDVDPSSTGGFTAVLINLGLTGVPFTLVLTLINLIAWLICYYAALIALPLIEVGLIKTLAGLVIAIISFAIALPITAYAIQPLRSLFRKLNDTGTLPSLLGSKCTIRTTRVDADFGEAECTINGLSHIIKVRSHSNNQFKHGDKAVIIEHDLEQNTYQIVTETEFNH